MADLRLDGSDSEWLYLAGPDGQSFRLLVDENLRKAIRPQSFPSSDASLISPREIQLEVRSGVSMEELAQKTGASLAYIEKFAAPVIDELAHVVKSALSVRITIAGDRYSETTQVEFGEVIANRLAAQRVVQPFWSARKSDNGGWQVHCSFDGSVATWAFDPRKLALSPENELAVSLGTQQSLTDGPIARLRPVTEPVVVVPAAAPVVAAPVPAPAVEAPAAAPVAAAPVPAPVIEAPVVAAPVIEDVVAEETVVVDAVTQVTPITSSGAFTADLGSTAEFEGVVPFGRNTCEVAPQSQDASNLANTADLLDALRKRRLERERDVLETSTSSIQIVEIEEQVDAVLEAAVSNETAAIEVVAEPEKPKPRGRTSMPSWDEIVFNTRSDD